MKFSFILVTSSQDVLNNIYKQFNETKTKSASWKFIVISEQPLFVENDVDLEVCSCNCTLASRYNIGLMKCSNDCELYFLTNGNINLKTTGWEREYFMSHTDTTYGMFIFQDSKKNKNVLKRWRNYECRVKLSEMCDDFVIISQEAFDNCGYFDSSKHNFLQEYYKRLARDFMVNETYPYDVNSSNKYIESIDRTVRTFNVVSENVPRHRNFETTKIKKSYSETDKILTFCIILKNRITLATECLDSLIKSNVLSYADIIIVEDASINCFSLPSDLRDSVKHIIVSTGDLWNRSKLLNTAFRYAKTPIVATCDVDFLFNESFGENLKKVLLNTNFDINYVRVNSIENGFSIVKGTTYNPGDVRGGMWIYNKQLIEKLNGYNENFVGWGFEEMDFHRRALSICNIFPKIAMNNVYVIHQSHDDDIRNIIDNASDNYKIYLNSVKEQEKNLQPYGNTYFIASKDNSNISTTFSLEGKNVAMINCSSKYFDKDVSKELSKDFDVIIRSNIIDEIQTSLTKRNVGNKCDIVILGPSSTVLNTFNEKKKISSIAKNSTFLTYNLPYSEIEIIMQNGCFVYNVSLNTLKSIFTKDVPEWYDEIRIILSLGASKISLYGYTQEINLLHEEQLKCLINTNSLLEIK